MKKEYQTLIVPILKGLPIIVLLLIGAVTLASRLVVYTVPEFQSTGSIKIDNRNINLGDLAIFEEDGRTKGATSVDFLTEVEMFKSKKLKELTLRKLDFELEIFRVGKIKTIELYQNSPFLLNYKINKEEAYDQFYYLKYVGNNEFLWSTNKEVFDLNHKIVVGDSIKLKGLDLVLNKNSSFLLDHPSSLQENDIFSFRINSLKAQVAAINSSNYFVRSVDKKIQIINLYFQHKVPEKAALFINTLMETYIENCKNEHQEEANKALFFIDEQLNQVKKKLQSSEGRLVKYKTRKSIMNIKQETDATLKEMMQLEFQKVNYDMQKGELKRTFEHLANGNDLRDFAPNFEALKDPLFKEAFLKAQNLEMVKQDLLLKFTPQSDEVQNIELKINNLRTFIHESVKNTLDNISARQVEMASAIANIGQNIQDFPDKEQQTMILQRSVKLNEQLYTSLIEKRMEIAVAKSANTVFHQVVDQAEKSEKPVTPNTALFYGVAIFFALLIGIGISFLKHLLTAKIKTKKELAQILDLPLIGSIAQTRKAENPVNNLGNLYTNLELIKGENAEHKKVKTILISSMLNGEGKTFTTTNLAKIYASMGKKVLIIDMDLTDNQPETLFGMSNKIGLADLLQKSISPYQAIFKTGTKNVDIIPKGDLSNIYSGILFAPQTNKFIDAIKTDYDIILIDAPAIGMVEDVTLMMKQVDFNLVVFRGKQTKVKTVQHAKTILKEHSIPNTFGVFNGAKNNRHQEYFNTISVKQLVRDTVLSIF